MNKLWDDLKDNMKEWGVSAVEKAEEEARIRSEKRRIAKEKAAEEERLANLDKSREEGEFKDGERDGLWTIYNKEGLKEKEITYELGVEIKQTFYNDQGIKEKEISIAEDKEENHTTFNENGTKAKEGKI